MKRTRALFITNPHTEFFGDKIEAVLFFKLGFGIDNKQEPELVHKITSRVVDLQDNGFVSGGCQARGGRC
jgi:hypothetical protein